MRFNHWTVRSGSDWVIQFVHFVRESRRTLGHGQGRCGIVVSWVHVFHVVARENDSILFVFFEQEIGRILAFVELRGVCCLG